MSRLPETTLNLIRGDTGKWDAYLTNPRTMLPVQLTGCSLRMAVWSSTPPASTTSDSGALFVLTSESGAGISIVSALSGQIEITIDHTLSNSMQGEIYSFDLQLTNEQSQQYTVAHGFIWIQPQRTHGA